MSITIKDNHWVEEAEGAYTQKRGGIIVPKMIVLHYTAGWTYKGDIHTLAWSSRRVSCQFVLGRKEGELAQLMPLNVRGWHAGPSYHKPSGLRSINNHSIGIEVSNHGYVEDMGGGEYKDWNGKTYREPPGGEAPPFDTWLKAPHWVLGATKSARAVWEPFTDWQLDTIDEIIVAAAKKYPTIKWVTRHEDIDTRHWKSDIGPAYPLERARAALMGGALIVPGEPKSPPTGLLEHSSPVPTGTADVGDAVMAITTGSINIRQQPRWYGACNIVSTLERGLDIFIYPDRQYSEFTQCLYLDDDNEFMLGWAPTRYVEVI